MKHRPVIFGEVLFDHFPDGARVLGGAPFNVAWNLQGLGLQPLFISCIGEDEDGAEISQQMQNWGMDLAGLQTDEHHATGRVSVLFRNGQPSYDILAEQAYDFIDAQTMLAAVENISAGILYYGSLALRQEENFFCLQSLQDKLKTLSFVDINLRAPWWTSSLIDTIVQRAHWLKVNDEEIVQLSKDKGIGKNNVNKSGQDLLKSYFLQGLILTKGSEGATVFTTDGEISQPSSQLDSLVDTVGAGDAFASVCIAGLMLRWDTDLMLQRALEFAAKVCGIQGATSSDPEFYDGIKQAWAL